MLRSCERQQGTQLQLSPAGAQASLYVYVDLYIYIIYTDIAMCSSSNLS